MTSDQWARTAVSLAIDVGASEIGVEGFAARETYIRVVKDALNRAKPDRPIAVTAWPPRGSGRGGGDSLARAAGLIQALEVGTCRLAGYLSDLEEAAVTWQTGQHQPDSLAALVVAHDLLVHAAASRVSIVAPDLTARIADPGIPGAASATPAVGLPDYLSGNIDGARYDPLAYARPTLRVY